MKRNLLMFAALLIGRGVEAGLAAVPAEGPPASRPGIEDTYTITATLELVRPFNPADMKDDFQDVRVLKQDADSCTVEITYHPLFRPEIGANANWREEYAGMTEYLRPTPTENWDEAMQRDLLAEVRAAGIYLERLTDRQVVEQVSRWAMRRSRSTNAFAIWTLHFPDGKPAVYPPLQAAFEREKSKEGKTDQQMFDQEALGRSMFYDKVLLDLPDHHLSRARDSDADRFLRAAIRPERRGPGPDVL
jgi:hypothetical protein